MAEAAEPQQEKPLRPKQCHKYMQKRVAEQFPAIVNGFISEALKGSCPHMKLAVELLESAKIDVRRGKSSVHMLLDQLGE
jgi:hypothetical protein